MSGSVSVLMAVLMFAGNARVLEVALVACAISIIAYFLRRMWRELGELERLSGEKR
jgi:Na+/H+ antiporter NhaC